MRACAAIHRPAASGVGAARATADPTCDHAPRADRHVAVAAATCAATSAETSSRVCLGTGQSPPRAAHRTSATAGAYVTANVFAARIVSRSSRPRPGAIAAARRRNAAASSVPRPGAIAARKRARRFPEVVARLSRFAESGNREEHRGDAEAFEKLSADRTSSSAGRPSHASHPSRSRRRTAATAAASASAPSESRAAAAWMNAYSNARDATRRTSSDRSPAATATRAYSRDRVVAKTPGSSVEMQKGWCAS